MNAYMVPQRWRRVWIGASGQPLKLSYLFNDTWTFFRAFPQGCLGRERPLQRTSKGMLQMHSTRAVPVIERGGSLPSTSEIPDQPPGCSSMARSSAAVNGRICAFFDGRQITPWTTVGSRLAASVTHCCILGQSFAPSRFGTLCPPFRFVVFPLPSVKGKRSKP